MSLRAWWPLLLLAALPALWWIRLRTRTDFSSRHLALATTARSLALLMLALALAEPVWNSAGRWLSVAWVVDVSQSVAPEELAAALDWISSAPVPDHARYVPFGANAFVLDDLEALRGVQVAETRSPDAVDQRGTDLEQALEVASHSLASDHIRRLVLITDGNETSGNVRSRLAGLARDGVAVYTRTLPARQGPDSWIEDVGTPRTVATDELYPVEVRVYSQRGGQAAVTLRDPESPEEKQTREVTLGPGMNRIGFEMRSDRTGPITLEAGLESPGDRFPGNNTYRASLIVLGAPRVLYVESRAESAVYLRTALELESIDVELIDPASLPDRPDQLDAYDAVILSDIRADAMTPAQMEAIATYVSDLGGGLILAGGESVFGEDGYSDTLIEEILPVRFDIEREPPTVSLIIVLDKSGSMGGQKLELVKEASKAAVAVLRDDQQIGLVAFDYNHYWPFELQPAANREAINQSISTIVAGGETNIFPALNEAHTVLNSSDSEIKHVILLSDGRSLPDDFRTLVESMVDAGQTVSTVAVGNGADRELLADIAGWGAGRDYFIEDATRVPQVFTEETELATQGTLREDSFRPVVLKQVEALKGIDFESAPPLLGYVATLERDTSEVLLASDDSEDAKPILARWQYGLGKTVAFTSDVKDRWAADWLDWDGYTKFWPQLVRETMRRHDQGELDITIERDGHMAKVELSAIDSEGGFRTGLDPEVRVLDPEGTTMLLDARQKGPATWRATFDASLPGPYVVTATTDTLRASRTLPYSYPEEYHLYPPDTALLEEISQTTGGRRDATAEEIMDPGTQTVTRSRELWPVFASAALLFYLVDLLLRRIRLFDAPA